MVLLFAASGMAATVTSLWADETVQAITYTINANEPVDLLTSGVISNASNFNSLKLTVEFTGLTPADVLLTGQVGVEVDFKDANGVWRLLPVYQSNWLRKSDQAPTRILIMQPNISQFEPGTTDIQFRGPLKVCETNRHQGTVPDVDLRVRMVLVEGSPGGSNAWSSVTVSAEIILYNV
jgi:hypothetical protein